MLKLIQKKLNKMELLINMKPIFVEFLGRNETLIQAHLHERFGKASYQKDI